MTTINDQPQNKLLISTYMNRVTHKMDEQKTLNYVNIKQKYFPKPAILFIECPANTTSNIENFDRILIKNGFDALGDIRREGKRHTGMIKISPKNLKAKLSNIRKQLASHSFEVVDWSIVLSK